VGAEDGSTVGSDEAIGQLGVAVGVAKTAATMESSSEKRLQGGCFRRERKRKRRRDRVIDALAEAVHMATARFGQGLDR